MKTLQIISTAYRATAEEQDDTIIWLTRAMIASGAEFALLLQGNAVNYAVAGQNAAGLKLGDWQQTQPPQLARDVQDLIAEGSDVYLVEEDVAERGLDERHLVRGTTRLARSEIPDFFGTFFRIWSW